MNNGLKIQWESLRAWYCKPSQPPCAGEVMGPRREPITSTFLKQCNLKLRSKYLSSYPWMSVALASHQRGCAFQHGEH